MLVKPITSLVLCALAVTASIPASAAVPLETSGTSTLVVSGSATIPAAAPAARPAMVKVTHRPRRSMKKKVVVKVTEHHAEPAKSPVVAAVVTAPITRVKTHPVKVLVHGRSAAKGEIMIGPKAEAKAVVIPAAPAKVVVPAEIDVKTEAPHAVRTSTMKIEAKPTKGIGTLHPVAQAAEVESGASRIALDVAVAPKVVAVAGLAPQAPQAASHAKLAPKAPCLREGVEFVRGQEAETFSLTRCDGSVAPLALEKLSVLARPESAPIPKSIDDLAKVKGQELSSGIRRIDPGLVERVEAIAEHFGKNGLTKVSVISGYRPMSSGSYHATAQALDRGQ
jgi:hypothetical protein